MKLLLDSHILIWAITDDSRLTEAARGWIEDPGNDIYYSTATIWKIDIKHNLHPDNVTFSGEQLADLCERSGFLNVPILSEHVFLLHTLHRKDGAPRHKDPFDQLLICQAKSEHMKLLTHDALLEDYAERCIKIV